MLERSYTFQLDAYNPNNEVLVRLLRLSAIPWIVIGLILVLTGALPLLALGGFLIAAVIDAAVIPIALRTLPAQIIIDPTGVTVPGRRATLFVPWSDVDLIEVRNASAQPGQWLFDLLRVNRNRDFVHVGIRTDSETRRKAQYLKRLAFYVTDPEQFARDANELRARA